MKSFNLTTIAFPLRIPYTYPGTIFMSSFDRTGGPLRATLVIAISVVLCWNAASAEEHVQPNDDLVCQNDATKLGTDRYLRAASLDLRGTLPTDSELEELDELPKDAPLPSSLLDQWLSESDLSNKWFGITASFSEYLSQVDLIDNLTSLAQSNGVYWARDRVEELQNGHSRSSELLERAGRV